MNYFISAVAAITISLSERTGLFAIFYLSTLPFIIFSGQKPLLLLLSLLLGYLLFYLFRKPSPKALLFFAIVLIVSIFIVKPRLGLDLGLINAINAQKGEHPNFQTSFLARLIHNKTELSHSFINNFDKLLSPVAIFASGFWHKLSPYYPLGYLFPWDIYFIYRYLSRTKKEIKKRSWLYLGVATTPLLFLSGFVYLDQAEVFAFALIYFLGLLASFGYSGLSKKAKWLFFTINLAFLVYQLSVTSYFLI